MRGSLLLAALLAALGECRSTVVVESLPVEPADWTRMRDAPADAPLRLRIALRQPNTALFERMLYEVSDPSHARYGQHLSRGSLSALMAPRAESTATVRAWLRDAGVPDSQVEEDGEWINLRVSTRGASALLDADFGVWRHDSTHAERVRALGYSVPEAVAEHITMVAPVVRFGQLRPARSQIFDVVDHAPEQPPRASAIPPQMLNETACNASITPECLRALYNVGSYQADAAGAGRKRSSLLGVCGYLEQWAKHDQLELFADAYAPYAADANFTAVGINGGVNKQGNLTEDDVEANLDVQYAVAMSYKTPVAYYSTGGRGPLVPDLEYVTRAS